MAFDWPEHKYLLCALGWVAVWLLVFLSCAPGQAREKTMVGFVEEVRIFPGDLSLQAKIDTGADNSSLHATAIMRIKRKGRTWVRFKLQDQTGRRHTLECPLVRMTGIKQDEGPRERRPVVELVICLGKTAKKVPINLNDRSNYKYKMLVGRSFLQGEFLVDTSRKFLTKPACQEMPEP